MNLNFSLNFSNPFKNKTLAAAPSVTKDRRKLPYTPKSVFRTRKDIKDWNIATNAFNNAEEPSNYRIQLLYNEIQTDALLYSQKENRNRQLFSSTIRLIKPDGEVDEEQSDLLRNLPIYRKLTQAMLDSEDYSNSLCELEFKKSASGSLYIDCTTLPRTNVVQQKGLFYPDYTNPLGSIAYREMPEYGTWLLEFNSGDIGRLNRTVSHVLFKRFAQACWSELCEIFGIPPRVIKTNTQDATMLDRAEKMMQDTGSAPWFIIDDAESFEWGESATTKGEVFESLISLCNNEISLVMSGAVIGQDTKFGNRSKDESAQEMLWLLVQSDMALVTEYWNTIALPALVKLGVIKGERRFEFAPSEDIGQLWKFTEGLLPYKEIDNGWLKDKFGVEITGDRAKTTDTGKTDLWAKSEGFFG
ncbi:Mu-like prophage protein gp29 [Sphingobacterium spiritivorum]|uniref:Mu-like prophage protein gp29 n=1 Tax=Sphingobacterium spiritivorum TaxID=258 RepID=A0A380CRF9_SPHSI|nr:DUF935 family protein [Sphingobacterium spiritivorum]SUJ26439.1 Mu-like prophage protein gp29 [Sphingobacterium spiritivorum]